MFNAEGKAAVVIKKMHHYYTAVARILLLSSVGFSCILRKYFCYKFSEYLPKSIFRPEMEKQ